MKLLTNWRTTLGGILLGVPPVILASAMQANFTVTAKWTFILLSISGIGGVFLGLSSKDADTHSTALEVEQATMKVEEGKTPKV